MSRFQKSVLLVWMGFTAVIALGACKGRVIPPTVISTPIEVIEYPEPENLSTIVDQTTGDTSSAVELQGTSALESDTKIIRNIHVGTRISYRISNAQIDFINNHYDFVMTPFLSQEVRESIQEPKLILYRSIQGTWTNFDHFDWEHINAHENMFCHHRGKRILTIWDSWLMNPNDLVDPSASDAMDHWINYYAVTASRQVYEYNYDGLFIDSASHKLSPGAVNGVMPDDYDPQTWRDGRVAALKFIKSYLPDKSVVFNGLHSDAGAEESLANTDGGMWEVFAFEPRTGRYYGRQKWLEVMNLVQNYGYEKTIVLVTKEQPGLTKDIQKRLFVVASYLLVSNPNLIFSMTDFDSIRELQYYPEYDVDLGDPLDEFFVNQDGLYIRQFQHGLVVVNPSETGTSSFIFEGSYQQVIPVAGGAIGENGVWDGALQYEDVQEEIVLPPVSGVLLVTR